MPITATAGNGKTSELAPDGNHVAACVGVIDLGTQTYEYNGSSISNRKVLLQWELVNEAMTDGRPFMVSAEFTLSLHEKSKLRPFLENWRGRPFTAEELAGFNLESLAGMGCMLNVVHETSKKGKAFANVKSASRLPKGMPPPDISSDVLTYSIADPIPEGIAEWIAGKIAASEEKKAAAHADRVLGDVPIGTPSTPSPDADDCPF